MSAERLFLIENYKFIKTNYIVNPVKHVGGGLLYSPSSFFVHHSKKSLEDSYLKTFCCPCEFFPKNLTTYFSPPNIE